MMTIESKRVAPSLDDDTRRLLSETTQRLVNHAVDRRVDHVVQTSKAEARVERRVWPVVLIAALLLLAGSIGWLVRGAVHLPF